MEKSEEMCKVSSLDGQIHVQGHDVSGDAGCPNDNTTNCGFIVSQLFLDVEMVGAVDYFPATNAHTCTIFKT